MAEQEGVPVAEIHGDFMAEPSLEALFNDHVHPNDEGYVLMTRSWFDAITGTGASSSGRGVFGFLNPFGS
jgi:lysophospholipase L1-like esterase